RLATRALPASARAIRRAPSGPRPCLQRSRRPSERRIPRGNVRASGTASLRARKSTSGVTSSVVAGSIRKGSAGGSRTGQRGAATGSPGGGGVVLEEEAEDRSARDATRDRIVDARRAVDVVERRDEAARAGA